MAPPSPRRWPRPSSALASTRRNPNRSRFDAAATEPRRAGGRAVGQIQEIPVPDIGDFDEVDVVEVLVAPGDEVAVDDPLITLESDKASMEVPAPAAGKVQEVRVKAGDKVGQGAVILTLETGEAGSGKAKDETKTPPAETKAPDRGDEAAKPAAEDEAPKPTSEATRPAGGEGKSSAAAPSDSSAGPDTDIDPQSFKGAHASPAVRRYARELGADLAKIEGSGRKGRILKEDVQGYVKKALAGGGPAATSGGALPAIPPVDFSRFGETEEKPLSRIRKVSATHLHRSWVNVPHVTQFEETDITELEAFRKAHGEEAKARGVKLTPVAFLLKASARALLEFPEFNSSLHPEGDKLILKKYVHIGVAVDTPDGLVVPVIRDVDRKGLYDLAGELGEVSGRARDGKLLPKDLQGGCFSISSLGGIGGTAFTPIVNAPEVAILGVSRSTMKPVWQDGEFVPRLMLPLSLSYDHRVIDGAAAARFIVYLSGLLSDLRRLLL
ncbi:MAG: dihydrolipoyllysine-residue acetyltransferase [Acidobacteria bacterium]|nr:dihydrolipoyllysine-residue acetyltransferase [Acidobacteriota bacterium]